MKLEPYTQIPEWGWTFQLSVHRTRGLQDLPSAPGAFCFAWVISGSVEAHLAGQTLILEAPSLFCLGSRDTLTNLTGDGEIRAVVFHPGVLNDAFLKSDPYDVSKLQGTVLSDHYYLQPFLRMTGAAPGPIRLNLPIVDRFQALFDRMEDQIHDRGDGYWPCRTRSLLLEALILTRQGFSVPQERDFVDRLLVHLHTHYAEAFSLPQLASQFATNRTTLAARFREKTGKSVGDYLRGLRIQVAEVLLRDTTLPVLEVVERTGFSDPSNFGRLFRKVTGLNPSDYRNKHNWILRSA